MKKLAVTVFCLVSMSLSAFAQSHSTQMSYDLSGGFGSYNGNSYTEIDFGLNYYPSSWFNWRNSVFTQFGSTINTVWGLDTAALFQADLYSSGRTFGIEVFAGPGLRFATEDSSGVFGKAGVTFALSGIRIGGGAQVTHYYNTREDKNDVKLPADEVQYFIVLSGGGAF